MRRVTDEDPGFDAVLEAEAEAQDLASRNTFDDPAGTAAAIDPAPNRQT